MPGENTSKRMQNNPQLSPPTNPVPFPRDPRQRRHKLIAFLGFGILIAVVAGVVLLLPAFVERGANQGDGTEPTASPRTASTDEERSPASGSEAVKALESKQQTISSPVAGPVVNRNTAEEIEAAEAEKALQKSTTAKEQLEIALQRQARLENAGARIWGVERLVTQPFGAMPKATKKLVDGDGHFRTGDFDRAAAAYRQAASRFEQLSVSRPERLDRALNRGATALEQLDDVGAAHHFEIALALEPGHAIAEKGLSRAQNLPRVLELFEQARRKETAGQLDLAFQGFREVEALDPDFQQTREARIGVERRIAERDYRRAVSEAFSALGRRDYSRSKNALATARRLRPNGSEVGEIAIRMQAAIQRDRLDNLRHLAGAHEQNEDWVASLREYSEALAIDADAAFAVRGQAARRAISRVEPAARPLPLSARQAALARTPGPCAFGKLCYCQSGERRAQIVGQEPAAQRAHR